MRNVIPWPFLFRCHPCATHPLSTIPLSHRVPTSLYFWQSTGPRKLRPFDRPRIWITNDIKPVLVHEIRRFPTVSLSPSFAEDPPLSTPPSLPPWSTISFGVSCLLASFQGCLSRGADNENVHCRSEWLEHPSFFRIHNLKKLHG